MASKIEIFKQRNRYRNTQLYQDGLIEGVDYIVCPVTMERLSMIKRSYIEKILSMSVDEYDSKYPGARRSSTRRIENIKTAVREVDAETGLPKYKMQQVNAKNTLSQVDPDSGLTGYQKKGRKTRNTHLSRVDELGRTGYQRQAQYRTSTILENGLTIEQNAHIKRRDKLVAKNKAPGASIQSKKALIPILEFLDEHNVRYYFDKTEYGLRHNRNYYFYDLTLPDFNVVIEYQSAFWHANPSMSDEEWSSWATIKGKRKTADEVLKYDYSKAKAIFESRGYLTYYVWEQTESTDVEGILCLLKTLNMKL